MKKQTLYGLGLIVGFAVGGIGLMMELANTSTSWASITCNVNNDNVSTDYSICGDSVNPDLETSNADCPNSYLNIPCECGDTVLSDTTLNTLDDPVVSDSLSEFCSGDGLYVDSYFTLSCAGATLRGDGYGNGITVDYEDGVTIKACHVENFANGVYANKSDYLTLNSVKARFNSTDGVHFDNVTSSLVKSCLLQDNYEDGLELHDSDGNTVQDARVERNGFGIFLESSNDNVSCSDNTITGNKVNSNYGEGIEADGNCDNNVISQNTVSGNIEGIELEGDANGNTISGNSVNQNIGNGIELEVDGYDSPDGNFILSNKVESNTADGIDVESSGNTVFANSGTKNGANGLEVDGGSGNALTNNKFNKNGGHGICTEVGTATNGGGNTGSANLTLPNVIFNSGPGC